MTPLHVTSQNRFHVSRIMYLTLTNLEPFWLCFNIRSTAIQCLQFVYRPKFFLNIPIPCYIFIKQMSLLGFFYLGGYLRIIPYVLYD